jgi:hypothetical protein
MRGKAGLVSARVFPKVELLLHFDGSNGSTTFTDSSSNALAVTAFNGAALSTSQAKFGTASLELDGVDSYAEATSQQLAVGFSDFTIECWFYARDVGNKSQCIFEYATLLVGFVDDSAGLGGNVMYAGDSGGNPLAYGTVVEEDVWHHVALTRQAETMRLFFNGALVGNEWQSAEFLSTNTDTGNVLRLGDLSWAAGQVTFDGFIDEFRIVKHEAVWVSNFTPPTSAY